jgi:hypothetical protein
MRPPYRHWPIRRCDLVLTISGLRFTREQQAPEALGALRKAMIEKWWPFIRELGIRAE